MSAGTEHGRGTAARVRLARRRVRTLLRSWRCPRFGWSPIDLGLVEAWRVEPEGDGGLAVHVCLRFVADACALAALARELCLRLLSLGLDHAAVEVSFDRRWCLADVSDAARLDLGLW